MRQPEEVPQPGAGEPELPNTLVHCTVQGSLGRAAWRLDPRWLYLGCLLPDTAWILWRAVVALGPAADPIALRAYAMGQASLTGSLLLCGAAAAASRRPRVIFPLLAGSAVLHLLLDACEVKWGNGVHLLAPFSWRMTSFGLVTQDGIAIAGLTLAGAVLLAWELSRPPAPRIGFTRRPGRLLLSAALGALYLTAPLATRAAVEASDSYGLRTLRQRESRPGRRLGLDRARFGRDADGPFVRLWTGERLRLGGELPPGGAATVSLEGTFLEPDLLRVERLSVQRWSRDAPSYLALALLALLWFRPQPAGDGGRSSGAG